MYPTARNRSQTWIRPGFYVAVRWVAGVEVLSGRRRGVQVAKHTIHGTASELRGLASQLLRAADLAETAPQA